MKKNKTYIGLILLAAGLLAGCSGSEGGEDVAPATASSGAPKEIRVTSNVCRRSEGTRTTTYENEVQLRSDNIIVYAYSQNTTTSYLSSTGETLHYDESDPARWKFWNTSTSTQLHYYWPMPASTGGAWPALDFFGYMPAAKPAYITVGPAYTAEHNVTFTCANLPMTNAGQDENLKEFMFAMALGQSYDNAAAGVPLQFQHPFTRIKLQLAASHPDITINSITFKSIKNNGSFTYDHSEATSTWVPDGDAVDFVLTLTGDAAVFDDNPATPVQIGDDYIMIPQDWAGQIGVNASWNDWGDTPVPHTVTTTLPAITWQSGYSYVYTFYITPEDLVVNLTNFTEQW